MEGLIWALHESLDDSHTPFQPPSSHTMPVPPSAKHFIAGILVDLEFSSSVVQHPDH